MSLEAGGRHILCDGEGCHARTTAPVALRPTQAQADQSLPASEGWLYILKQGTCLYFCPSCARLQLERYQHGDKT